LSDSVKITPEDVVKVLDFGLRAAGSKGSMASEDFLRESPDNGSVVNHSELFEHAQGLITTDVRQSLHRGPATVLILSCVAPFE
jgi:hypothetical protein